MSFIGKEAGAAVGEAIVKPLFGLVDELFTSDEERSEAKRRLFELHQKGRLAQIAVNIQEAKSESLFVSGWRPFIGWTCGVAFAYTFVIQPFFLFLAWAAGTFVDVDVPVDLLPTLDLSQMLPVLLGMLGLGGLRTYEKRNGVNKNR